jgi:hypothetical protein
MCIDTMEVPIGLPIGSLCIILKYAPDSGRVVVSIGLREKHRQSMLYVISLPKVLDSYDGNNPIFVGCGQHAEQEIDSPSRARG